MEYMIKIFGEQQQDEVTSQRKPLLVSPDRPSFFELIAVDQLTELLRPAIEHIIRLLHRRYPDQRSIEHILHHTDTYYMVLWLAIEHYDLNHYGKKAMLVSR
jgi:hypothetical protein